MGIKGLSHLIADNAPASIRELKLENYFSRKVAIDASMHIYQFMVGALDEASKANAALPRREGGGCLL